MTSTAGFAVLGCVSQDVINAALRTLFAGQGLYTFALPDAVTVAGTPVTISGSLGLLAPQVTFQARPDHRVAFAVTFAGDVALVAENQNVAATLLVGADVYVGLTTDVTPLAANTAAQIVTVGLDVASAQVTSVDVEVLLAPPLAPVFHAAITSQAVLDVLTAAVRAIPPDLLRMTAANLTLPLLVAPTYPPANSKASTFFPYNLFSVQFTVDRIVAWPVDAATPGRGALAVGVDLIAAAPASFAVGTSSAPSTRTRGTPSSMVDLNTVGAPSPVLLDFQNNRHVAFDPGGGAMDPASNIAVAVNGDFLCSVVNDVISLQLYGVFPPGDLTNEQISFRESNDCLQISLGNVYAPLDGPLTPPIPTGVAIPGMTAKIKLTRWMATSYDSEGYLVGASDIPGNADADVTLSLAAMQIGFSQEPTWAPTAPGPRVPVTFTTAPEGGYIYLEGMAVTTGRVSWAKNVVDLPAGRYVIGAHRPTFGSWTVSGGIQVDDATSNPTNLTVTGSGTLTLLESAFDPYFSPAWWNVAVIGLDISLPGWVTLVAAVPEITNLLTFGLVADVVGLLEIFGIHKLLDLLNEFENLVDPGVISSTGSSLGSASIQSSLGNAVTFGVVETMQRLPGTAVPDWTVNINDVAFTTDGIATYVALQPCVPSEAPSGSTGAFPYLMIAAQDKPNPLAVFAVSPELSDYPYRVDGTLQWPGVAWSPGVGRVPFAAADLRQIVAILMIPAGMINPADPSWIIEWKAVRTDTGAVIETRTAQIVRDPAALVMAIDHASADLQAADGFVLTCRLYQQLPDGTTSEFFNSGTVYLPIEDLYDRHHPYIRLQRDSAFVYPGQPFWNAIPAAAHRPGVRWVKRRSSQRIHRTDVWHGGWRCLVAREPYASGRRHARNGQSLPAQQGFTGPPSDPPGQYLDTLPISLEVLRRDRDAARGILCDYCFFGGPTRTVLRDDFPFMHGPQGLLPAPPTRKI